MERRVYWSGEFCLVVISLVSLPAVLGDIRTSTERINDEDRLLKALMEDRGYNPKVRPVYNISSVVNVSIDIAVNQVIHFDEPKMVLRSETWMRVYWHDELLTWNASEYSGLTSFFIPAHDVWLPDVTLYSSVVLYPDGLFGNVDVLVRITCSGDVAWFFPTVIESRRGVDMTQFPYDTQRCEHEFGSWAYDGYKVDIYPKISEGDVDNFIDNGEWEMIGVPARRRVKSYKCCGHTPFPSVIYTYTLKRRPTFYIVNMIMPCFVITLVNLFSFLLPVRSGERITFNITTLLALVVFLRLVAEHIPPQAEAVPMIVWFFGLCILILCLSTVAGVFVYRIHFSGEEQKPFPRWARRFIHGPIGRLLGSKYDNQEQTDVFPTDGSKDTPSANVGKHPKPSSIDNTRVAPLHSMNHQATQTVNGEQNEGTTFRPAPILPGLLHRATFVVSHNEKLWKEFAHCIDTLFFILFLFVTVGLSVYMLA